MRPRVLLVTPPGPDGHDTGLGHPERAARTTAALAGVDDAHLDDALATNAGRDATTEELELVHDARYVAALAAFARDGGGRLDPDTVVGPTSFAAAVRAVGCGLEAVDALGRGDADTAFVVARPPGHHASRARGQGFCLFNNVAIAAAALVARGERVVIVDWDVHHGNGTQDIFWDDPNVLYVSTHQYPAYPGTGGADEIGGVRAAGLTLNFPLPPGATGDVALAALDEVVAPAVDRFGPTWVLVSAGFDAHRADPLAELAWSAGDYSALGTRVLEFAPGPGSYGGVPGRRLRPRRAPGVDGGDGVGVGGRRGGNRAADGRGSGSRRGGADPSRVGGLTPRWSTLQQLDDLVVAGRAEVAVPLTDGAERLRRRDAHHLVGEPVTGPAPCRRVPVAPRARRARRRMARATSIAARAVLPVASPSSTMMTLRPRNDTRGVSGPESPRAALELEALAVLDRGDVGVGDPERVDDLVVEDAHAVLADRAHRQLGLRWAHRACAPR